MLSKRIVLSAPVVGVLAIAVSVATAFAILPTGGAGESRQLEVVVYGNGCPGRDCPPDFTKRLAIRHAADHNKDGFVCEKTTRSGERIIIDNCVAR